MSISAVSNHAHTASPAAKPALARTPAPLPVSTPKPSGKAVDVKA